MSGGIDDEGPPGIANAKRVHPLGQRRKDQSDIAYPREATVLVEDRRRQRDAEETLNRAEKRLGPIPSANVADPCVPRRLTGIEVGARLTQIPQPAIRRGFVFTIHTGAKVIRHQEDERPVRNPTGVGHPTRLVAASQPSNVGLVAHQAIEFTPQRDRIAKWNVVSSEVIDHPGRYPVPKCNYVVDLATNRLSHLLDQLIGHDRDNDVPRPNPEAAQDKT